MEMPTKARRSDGTVPLNSAESGVFMPTMDTLQHLLGPNQPLRALLHPMVKKQPVLRCSYGPVGTHSSGEPKFETYRFWHGKAPDNIAEILAVDTGGALAPIRTRAALGACPLTSALASVAFGSKSTPK
jgi:hypothetical protein